MRNTVLLSASKKRLLAALLSFFRFILVFGLAFIILKPLIYRLLLSFMSPADLLDNTVQMIPKHFSLYYWKEAIAGMNLMVSMRNTLILSLSIGLLQVISCTMVGYGLGRFRFVGKSLAFIFVIIIMLVPYQVIGIAQYLDFSYFRVGPFTLNLSDTFIPLYILAFTGLGVKEGLYIYLMKETFAALPHDLEDAAYIDGAGTLRTFWSVMLPNARTMLVTVFLFSFCWQWTDTTYSTLHLRNVKILANAFGDIIIRIGVFRDAQGTFIAKSAGVLIIMFPLLLLFGFCQKFLVNSLSHTGLSNG